jgi:hypothetical protein
MALFNFRLDSIQDPSAREALQTLKDELNRLTILRGEFRFYELTIDRAVTDYRYSHKLPFRPRDLLQTSVTGTGQVSFSYSDFDETFIQLTTTGPVTVRFYLGSFKEEI